MSSKKRYVWERTHEENEKAFVGFQCYLEQEPGKRRVRKAYETYQMRVKGIEVTTDKSDPNCVGVPGYFAAWCRDHDWTERALEYDNWMANQIHRQAAIMIAKARTEYLNHLTELVETHLEVALGLSPETPNTQWQALKDALDRAGVKLPERLELTGRDGGPMEQNTKARVEHGTLDFDKAKEVALVLKSLGIFEDTTEDDDGNEGDIE